MLDARGSAGPEQTWRSSLPSSTLTPMANTESHYTRTTARLSHFLSPMLLHITQHWVWGRKRDLRINFINHKVIQTCTPVSGVHVTEA